MKKQFKIVVTGKVQRVCYRQSALDKALALGVSGTVKNLKNGDVEIIIQGEEEQIRQITDWCRQGPPTANVTGIIVTELKIEQLSGFQIIY